jgi:hypothetical protein
MQRRSRANESEGHLNSRILGRRRRGLLWFWIIGIAAAGLVFWITRQIPALTELLRPLYWIIGLTLAVFTIRWFRPRTGDRRQIDRRHSKGEKQSSDPGYHAE